MRVLEVWARRRQVAGRVRGAVGWREGGAPGERGHAQTRDGSSAPAPSLPSQPSAAATHTTASPQAQAQPARPHPPEALECVPDLLHGRHGGDVSHIQLQRICGRRREEGGGGCGRGQHRRQLLDGCQRGRAADHAAAHPRSAQAAHRSRSRAAVAPERRTAAQTACCLRACAARRQWRCGGCRSRGQRGSRDRVLLGCRHLRCCRAAAAAAQRCARAPASTAGSYRPFAHRRLLPSLSLNLATMGSFMPGQV